MMTMVLNDLLDIAMRTHKHLCPRQVLGVRMGMMAATQLGLELPQRDKRLLTIVETDGCFADGISAATGCLFGRRTLRLEDYGRVAATFIDTKTERAVRIAPHPTCRQNARQYAPQARSRWHAQLEAYQLMPEVELLVAQPVELRFDLQALIGRPGVRVNCDRCGEEIINGRELHQGDETLCRACAGRSYYHLLT